MKGRLPRAGWVRLGECAAVTAILALSGCAWNKREDDAWAAKVPIVEQPASQKVERTDAAPVKESPKEKAAAARPPGAYSPAAKEPPAQTSSLPSEASCSGVDTCTSVLRTMVESPDRSWIGRPVPAAVLANGVRLFAYRALKSKLSCAELAAAVAEVEAGAQKLAGHVEGLSPAQLSRTRALCAEVGGELRAERARRCLSGGKVGGLG